MGCAFNLGFCHNTNTVQLLQLIKVIIIMATTATAITIHFRNVIFVLQAQKRFYSRSSARQYFQPLLITDSIKFQNNSYTHFQPDRETVYSHFYFLSPLSLFILLFCTETGKQQSKKKCLAHNINFQYGVCVFVRAAILLTTE